MVKKGKYSTCPYTRNGFIDVNGCMKLSNQQIESIAALKDSGCQMAYYEETLAILDHVGGNYVNRFFGQEGLMGGPIKLDYCLGTCVLRGYIDCVIGMQEMHLEAEGLNVVLPNTIMEVRRVSDDFVGQVLIMSSEFLESLRLNQSLIAAISVRHQVFFPFVGQETDYVKGLFSQMVGLLNTTTNPYRLDAARALITAAFYGLGYYLHLQHPERERTTPEYIAEQFLQLVEKHCVEHHDTDFYAGKLCISSKYLSICVKKSTGRTAMEWIRRYLVQQAQVMLGDNTLSIQQISNTLNFANQVLFSKFFKRETGQSPMEHRKRRRGIT